MWGVIFVFLSRNPGDWVTCLQQALLKSFAAPFNGFLFNKALLCTLPETNIAPANRLSQKESSLPTTIFRAMIVSVSATIACSTNELYHLVKKACRHLPISRHLVSHSHFLNETSGNTHRKTRGWYLNLHPLVTFHDTGWLIAPYISQPTSGFWSPTGGFWSPTGGFWSPRWILITNNGFRSLPIYKPVTHGFQSMQFRFNHLHFCGGFLGLQMVYQTHLQLQQRECFETLGNF